MSTAAEGVSSAGVVKDGETARATAPVPVVACAVGSAAPPVKFPNTVLAAMLARSIEIAGVVVGFATLVVIDY